MLKSLFFSYWLLFLVGCSITTNGQNGYIITGTVVEASSFQPMQNATVHLIGSQYSTFTKIDGSFSLYTTQWYDSLEITSVGFERCLINIEKDSARNLSIIMRPKTEALQEVTVGISKKPGKAFMEKVIDQKDNNNPSRFRSYSYRRYTRNELDIDHIDFDKVKGLALKNLMLKTYAGIDSNAKEDRELPVYFTERIANSYHSVSPNINRENIIAKKSLGLKTDNLLSHLDKFYFFFNIYDNWLPVFDQTYVSPLNSNAFSYYKYFEGDQTLSDNGDTLQQIRFMPLHEYERAFSGTLWINRRTMAVERADMHLSKTANLNFINDINYSQDYNEVYDSTSERLVYMPYKFSSEVKFESGLALLGVPADESKKSLKFIIKNTTVLDKIQLNTSEPSVIISELITKEQTTSWDRPESFWLRNRPDSLTPHEKNIYRMVDSLKENNRFQRDVKIIAFAGTGYWDFGKYARVGPYSSFLSLNPIEGWRFRLGFWTMPGISKKINLFGYGAYGTKDQKLKGMLGVKYVWNEARWTKTSVSYGSDYDFIIDQDDELDDDNIVNSLFRKNIPFTRMYIKQALLKHEQYLSPNFTAKASITYKELNPVFDFQYRPINPVIDQPYDSVFAKMLPVAEATFGIRYAHKERTTILNYDNIKLGTFFPILFANYSYGFELAKAEFEYQKVDLGIEQRLRLPPKMMLYYKLEAGEIFGTVPYLVLNIPSGNEYYVASKYRFNTMSPYEFASDRYVGLHTRLYLGGLLFDKIPWIRKLGWRERFSFNAYWGDMSQANIDYNRNSNFNLIHKTPFAEASAGIENIFHVLSIEYYRRLNYLNNPYAKKDGIYAGVTLMF